jgi:hypothetical protein
MKIITQALILAGFSMFFQAGMERRPRMISAIPGVSTPAVRFFQKIPPDPRRRLPVQRKKDKNAWLISPCRF